MEKVTGKPDLWEIKDAYFIGSQLNLWLCDVGLLDPV